MRLFLGFILLAASFLAILILAIVAATPHWVLFIPIGVGIISLIIIIMAMWLPQRTVSLGLELIRAQDYNNRLVKVGEPNSDRIVTLFNSLIDRLRAERLQNREQESLLTLLIEASPMGVVMLDFDHRVTLANKSFLKIVGLPGSTIIKGKHIADIENDFIPIMTQVPSGQSEIIRQGNFKIYRIYHLNFVQEGFKREFYLVESLTDEIIKAEKSAYEKVIRTISHEVNNTMGGVRSVLEIVGENTEDDDIRKVVDSCYRRCESMGNFIREYAEVVKLPEPAMKSIDLANEIDMILPFLQRIMPRAIELKYDRPSHPFEIKGDSGLLQQVILNIVKNAVESIEETGFVRLELSRSNDAVALTISNNGASIDEKTSGQLFTPFFTTKHKGKGIGLTLVREVLTRHGAEYSLATGADGITRFTILFINSTAPQLK